MSQSLLYALYGVGGVAVACVVLSVITKEHGWIDRVWSIAPVGFAVHFMVAGGATPRLVAMAACVAAWGGRLTYNFARKGGYKLGGEDYRWQVLRAQMSPALFFVVNVLYIAIFQNAILLGMVLPMWAVESGIGMPAGQGAAPLGPLDTLATVLFVLFLIGETVADEQQWRFQEDKRRRRERGETIRQGFLTTGLFRYSRHPNFFCEMGMWWALYLFSVSAGSGWLNWSILGALVLTLQFQGSTQMTEKLSREKYPDYARYQETTSRLIPWIPRGQLSG